MVVVPDKQAGRQAGRQAERTTNGATAVKEEEEDFKRANC